DNDGDSDLLVLGRGESVRLFENKGGSFEDITFRTGSQIGGHEYDSSSCAMGDVNGDGLLDVFIGNTFDWSTKTAIAAEPWALNEPNQLFLNAGGGKFTDVSDTSGIRNTTTDISWSAVMFDYDKDGDLDITVANDQGAMPSYRYGGVNRGFVRTFKNDGTGKFTDVTRSTGLRSPGGYMGLAVADYNGDRNIDLYVSNVGDWIEPFLGLPYVLGDQTTRWFLANGDGTYRDTGVGALRASGWSWGASATDYDNDGDFDIATVGGLDVGPFVDRSNPGTILVNDGRANFTFSDVLAKSGVNHPRRNGHALATGDLNNDGFEDVVTVSDTNGAPDFPLFSYGFGYGTSFEHMGGLILDWFPADPLFNSFVWSGVPLLPGTLSIDMNSGGNGNGWVNIDTVGGKGIVGGAKVNRDGIGATVRFTPAGGATATQPILGGSSHSSQDSLLAHFGLGKARRGMAEVTWQGGVKNRLYGVRAGETVAFPEIPCDYSASWPSSSAYTSCVSQALSEAVSAGVITAQQRTRFQRSAEQAYAEAH
ncbi:MAG TPA: CRTAC1 family protein, partial [Thermoanaerobaculia bacterium]|nr:CRTAC1 family protein [Thermoanaerobaculia bacterium]